MDIASILRNCSILLALVFAGPSELWGDCSTAPVARDEVKLWEDPYCRGASLSLRIGDLEGLSDLRSAKISETADWNDTISSIKVGDEILLEVFQAIGFRLKPARASSGARTRHALTDGKVIGPRVVNLPTVDRAWNDVISSVRLVRHSRTTESTTRWSPGAWSECDGNVQTREVRCEDRGRTKLPDSACPGAKPDSVSACGDFSSARGDWVAGPWGDCVQNVQSRSVQCQDGGTKLPDSACPGIKPLSLSACGDLSSARGDWIVGPWGDCASHVQSRDVQCQDGSTKLPVSACPGIKPVGRRNCRS